MHAIYNGDITINNTLIQLLMMKTLIQQLIKNRDDDFITGKQPEEISRQLYNTIIKMSFWPKNQIP